MVAEQEIIGCDVATLLNPETGQEEESIVEHLIKNRWQSLIPSHFEQNTLEGL